MIPASPWRRRRGPRGLSCARPAKRRCREQSRAARKLTVFVVEDDGSAFRHRSESSSHEVVNRKVAADRIAGNTDPARLARRRDHPAHRMGAGCRAENRLQALACGIRRDGAPPSAIHAGRPEPAARKRRALARAGNSRAMLHSDGHEVEVGHCRIARRAAVRGPAGARFDIEMYEGGQKPKSYASPCADGL